MPLARAYAPDGEPCSYERFILRFGKAGGKLFCDAPKAPDAPDDDSSSLAVAINFAAQLPGRVAAGRHVAQTSRSRSRRNANKDPRDASQLPAAGGAAAFEYCRPQPKAACVAPVAGARHASHPVASVSAAEAPSAPAASSHSSQHPVRLAAGSSSMDGPAAPNRSSRRRHHLTSTATASRRWTSLSGHSVQRQESSSDSEASQLIVPVLPRAPSHEPTRVVARDASQLTVPLLPPGPLKRTGVAVRVLWYVSIETLRRLPQILPDPGWWSRIEAQICWFLTVRQLRDILGTPTYTRTEGTGIEIRYALKHAAAPPWPMHQVAWHGTSLYNLAAILHDGHLRDSTPETGSTLYRRDGTAIIGVIKV